MRQQPREEYRGYRTAGVRFTEELSSELNNGREDSEHVFLTIYHMFDKAHVVMLTEAGIIPAEKGRSILSALRGMEAEGVEAVRSRVGGGMHSGELYLIRTLGEDVGGWEHLARSSADLGAVGERVYFRERLLDLLEALCQLAATLVNMGDREAETLWPAYLHWQQIEPTTLGHYLSATIDALGRDFERGKQAYARINRSPAGAMVLSGSTYPVRLDRVAQLMGFDRPIDNLLDAFSDWDHVRDAFGVLAPAAAHLCKFGEDLSSWAGSDQGFISLQDRYTGGSSVLMQIRSPLPPSLAKGLLSLVMGGMVTAYMVDATPTHMSLFPRRYAVPQLQEAFDKVTGALTLLDAALLGARFDREAARMRVGSRAAAADLAGAMVDNAGISWRTAHQICGILFRLCEQEGHDSCSIDSALVDRAAVEYFDRPLRLDQARIDDALDPHRYVRRRTSPGGSAPEEVRRQLSEQKKRLDESRQWIQSARAQMTRSATLLESAIDEILSR